MTFHFEKYHGNGNDFIIIDDRQNRFVKEQKVIAGMCNRHFGIGADGLILLRESDHADFEMLYFNADGASGTMCGNGGRCIAAFAKANGIAGDKMVFAASDGLHHAEINQPLKNAQGFHIALSLNPVESFNEWAEHYFIDTGSPHHITFVPCVQEVDVVKKGQKIRYSSQYAPHGTNVDFVAISENRLFVRTYERGVENETLSCGTGVTASALAAFLETGKKDWRITTLGGDFTVDFKWDGKHFTDIRLKGPAEKVFEGKIEL